MSQVCSAEKCSQWLHSSKTMTFQGHISKPLTLESDKSTDLEIPIHLKYFNFQNIFPKCEHNCKWRMCHAGTWPLAKGLVRICFCIKDSYLCLDKATKYYMGPAAGFPSA